VTDDLMIKSSYSELGTHRRCPQAWLYSYERQLQKVDPEDIKCELEFGQWWHMLLGADALVRGRNFGSLQRVPKRLKSVDGGPTIPGDVADIGMVFGHAEEWWQRQTPLTWETWAARMGEALPDRLQTLYSRWTDEWQEERSTERPLTVEMGWGRELPAVRQPDGSATQPNTRLVGYVDEIYLDTRRNLIVARDWKSSKTLGTQSTADDMMDSQLQFYAWGASPEVTSWGLGRIGATAYDRVRASKDKTPAVTQAGTLGKSITDFGLETYVEWARGPDGRGVPYPGRAKDGSGAGFYQLDPDVVERLATPAARSVFFQRTLTPLNPNLIKVHLRAAVDSSLDLQLTRARATVTGEAARNLGSACRWCDYAKLCRAQMVGGVEGEYELADFNLRQRPPR